MRKLVLVLALLGSAACGDDPVAPPGLVSVQVTTTGIDRDGSYEIRVGGKSYAVSGSPAAVIISDLRPGRHDVVLEGIAGNCTAVGTASLPVTVRSGTTQPAQFAVGCVSIMGVIGVTTTTIGGGTDPDGFTIVMGSAPPIAIGARDSAFFPGFAQGDYPVVIGGLALNCSVTPNPRTIRVITGTAVRDTARTTFAVNCASSTGSIRTTTRTTGVEPDPDGYSLLLDGSVVVASLGTNATANLTGVTAQDHSVRLSGVAPNCTVAEANPQLVTVVVDATSDITFNVTCVSTRGDIRIVTQTTGSDLDPDGYEVAVNAQPRLAIPVNGSARTPLLPVGGYSVRLDGVASNCTVSGPNPRPVTVTGGNTAEVLFTVSCSPVARIEVSATTTGIDPDRDGYRLELSGTSHIQTLVVSTSGTVRFDPLPFGTYSVAVRDLAPNCETTGSARLSVDARAPVVPVNITVTCTALERIAFSKLVAGGNWDIHTSKADGSDIKRIMTGPAMDVDPSWSAATGLIVYASGSGGSSDIYVVDEAGNLTRLTTGAGRNLSPVWSPDGRRIAFASNRSGVVQLYVMDADGGNVTRVTTSAGSDIHPALSPDGTSLAFTRADCSTVGCYGNIWLLNLTSLVETRLTSAFIDSEPSWSADGSRIVFSRVNECGSFYYYTCERNLAVMNANGSNLVILPGDSSDEGDPSQSARVSRIAVAVAICGYYSCLEPAGIRMVRPDGSDPVMVLEGQVTGPVFRR